MVGIWWEFGGNLVGIRWEFGGNLVANLVANLVWNFRFLGANLDPVRLVLSAKFFLSQMFLAEFPRRLARSGRAEPCPDGCQRVAARTRGCFLRCPKGGSYGGFFNFCNFARSAPFAGLLLARAWRLWAKFKLRPPRGFGLFSFARVFVAQLAAQRGWVLWAFGLCAPLCPFLQFVACRRSWRAVSPGTLLPCGLRSGGGAACQRHRALQVLCGVPFPNFVAFFFAIFFVGGRSSAISGGMV